MQSCRSLQPLSIYFACQGRSLRRRLALRVRWELVISLPWQNVPCANDNCVTILVAFFLIDFSKNRYRCSNRNWGSTIYVFSIQMLKMIWSLRTFSFASFNFLSFIYSHFVVTMIPRPLKGQGRCADAEAVKENSSIQVKWH